MFEKPAVYRERRPGVWAAPGVRMPREIRLAGAGSIVVLGTEANCSGAVIDVTGNNAVVVVGAYATAPGARIRVSGRDGLFWLGAFTTSADLTVGVVEGRHVAIGDESMLSNRVIIDTSDGHGIYDLETGKRINQPRDVEIGHHVWIGRDVRVGKGAVVGPHSVIGQGSFVSGEGTAAPNAIYAGVPARLVRDGVTWTRMHKESLEEVQTSARHLAHEERKASLLARCV